MKPSLFTVDSAHSIIPSLSISSRIPNSIFKSSNSLTNLLLLTHPSERHPLCAPIRCSSPINHHNLNKLSKPITENPVSEEELQTNYNVEIASPKVPSYLSTATLSLSDQAFFLLAFIACTTSIAFTSLVVAAVPTLVAMGRAATSLAKLADTAREELPSTMAAIRLSGMEISDLTLELSDLSQEIADGVNKSAQAVQAAEAGIRQFGALARQQTISMIQERASLPVISLKPVVTGAAKKTSRAVGQATKTVMNIISGGEFGLENEGDRSIDRVEI